MKLIEILKAEGLVDEKINNITSTMKKNKIYETSLENADERYFKLKSKNEELETQLKTSNGTVETLKKSNKDNETLQQTISEYETTIEKLKKEADEKDFSYSLRDELKEAGCIDSKALEAYLTKENLKLEGGKIVGLEEQLSSLKESKKYLFEDIAPQNTGGIGNFARGRNSNLDIDSSQSTFMDAIRNNSLRK
ncbi:phage scaffolding protein [Paraclostridium ghonii]|uniref:phage scaffolding protein n=1 Tax=Paraclostridium ghonii TaxID=29358 RepID=UPI00202CE543|nr:phage scaffolding protein [Paeniclostridium ghonii]MCM0165654.1 phage scaffolding protein [Paeniclostridium ghonii]